jgi:uncharacterized iron-regulated protein
MRWLVCLLWAGMAQAQEPWAGADILVLGEVHDNPAHHLYQADIIAKTRPTGLVFEMLTTQQILDLRESAWDGRDVAALAGILDWEDAGWPDFAIYAPVFAASPGSLVLGAAPSQNRIQTALDHGAAVAFGPEATAYGLTPLTPADQQAREAEQAAAHCGALPPEMLAGMVDVQRLRDASFARAAIDAFDRLGGPVILITGTGHARNDIGVPAAIRAARPDLTVWSLGQMESAEPAAPYDAVNVTDPVDRPDPCLAFQ